MRERARWLPWAVYLPMAAAGACFAHLGHGSVVRPPTRWLQWGLSLELSLGLLLALAVARLTVLGTRWLVAHTSWARELHIELRARLRGSSAARLTELAVLSALAEELFFRAALMPAIGLVGAAFVFAAVHLRASRAFLPWAVWALAMGLVFGGLYGLSGHLAPPILAHALINYENMQFVCHHDPTLRV